VLSTFVVVVDRPSHRRLYLDIICQDPETQRRDSLFVRAGLMALLAPASAILPGTKRITLGTDTCAGQFRSRRVAPQFAGLKEYASLEELRLMLHAEHHGHDLADAHVARAREGIRQYLLECEGQRQANPDLASSLLSPLKTASDLQRVLTQHFSSTASEREADYLCIVLPTVNRDAALKPDARRLPGIMRLHDFVFVSATEVLVKELSTDAKANVMQLRFNVPWDFVRGSEQPMDTADHDGDGPRQHQRGAKPQAPAATPPRLTHAHTHVSARAEEAIDFGTTFADIRELKKVEVQYHDEQMPAVLLWQAEVVEVDETTQTFKLHIVNTGKTVPGVPAKFIRARQRGSAAV